jgi:hypothetical protein
VLSLSAAQSCHYLHQPLPVEDLRQRELGQAAQGSKCRSSDWPGSFCLHLASFSDCVPQVCIFLTSHHRFYKKKNDLPPPSLSQPLAVSPIISCNFLERESELGAFSQYSGLGQDFNGSKVRLTSTCKHHPPAVLLLINVRSNSNPVLRFILKWNESKYYLGSSVLKLPRKFRGHFEGSFLLTTLTFKG